MRPAIVSHRSEFYCLVRHVLTVPSFSMRSIINKLSESQLNADYSLKRIGSCQSNGLMREV